MSLPDLPVIEPVVVPLPDPLKQLAEESVTRFRSQFPGYLRPIAESQGWVEQYRNEIDRVIRETIETVANAYRSVEEAKR